VFSSLKFKNISVIFFPKETTGLGFINDSESASGYHFHPTLAATVEGTPLGILDSQVWIKETRNKSWSLSGNT